MSKVVVREPLVVVKCETPGGALFVVSDPVAEIVVASAFGTRSAAERHLPPELASRGIRRAASSAGSVAVAAWADGDLAALDAITVQQPGTDFLQTTWTALRGVRAGSVVTYGELAQLAGRPKAARAAGHACAINRVAPFVPCHRVVPSSGGVGNYGFGVSVKVALLAHEHAAL